jgi:hypothetical protein
MAVTIEPGRGKHLSDPLAPASGNLNQRTGFFAEQRRQHILTELIQLHRQPAVAGESHLTQRRQQTAVGAVMIGQQQTVAVQSADDIEKRYEPLRIIEIGRPVTGLRIHLSQRRPAQAVFTVTEIDQQQFAVTLVQLQLRCQRAADIAHRGERRDDQR